MIHQGDLVSGGAFFAWLGGTPSANVVTFNSDSSLMAAASRNRIAVYNVTKGTKLFEAADPSGTIDGLDTRSLPVIVGMAFTPAYPGDLFVRRTGALSTEKPVLDPMAEDRSKAAKRACPATGNSPAIVPGMVLITAHGCRFEFTSDMRKLAILPPERSFKGHIIALEENKASELIYQGTDIISLSADGKRIIVIDLHGDVV